MPLSRIVELGATYTECLLVLLTTIHISGKKI